MKVLLLPVNLASDISHKVRALRRIGVDARGFSLAPSKIQTGENITTFSLSSGKRLPDRVRKFVAYQEIWRMIAWADVLHWVGEPVMFEQSIHRAYLKWIDKPGIVQFMGSDIRIPDADFEINPYYRNVFHNGYEYVSESRVRSLKTQHFYAELNYFPLEFIGLERYIDQGLFAKRFRTWQPVDLASHEAIFPVAVATRPVVVHAPSAPKAKGTEHIIGAVEQLKAGYEFDFVLVENMERRDALRQIRDCDIFIDQLILGSHGYAAVEAMAFGKPVIAYINDVIGKDYPHDLPLVNANPDNIAEVLGSLIGDGERRHKLGIASRKYAEKYHDEDKIARDLVDIYAETIRRHRA